MYEWRRFRRGHFPIALFVDARAEITLLGPLFDNKRRAAFRARLGNRFVRRREIALGIAAAAIKNSPGTASLGSAAPHKLAFITFRAFDSQRDRTRVLALRIILAANKIAEAPGAANQLPTVLRTLFADRNVGLQ